MNDASFEKKIKDIINPMTAPINPPIKMENLYFLILKNNFIISIPIISKNIPKISDICNDSAQSFLLSDL
jgi:hypothetical protein